MWWVGPTAEAHVGDVVGGIDLTVDDGRAEIEASYGLVVPGDDGYRWICHEAVTEPGVVRSPRYARSRDGVWLGWLPDPALGRDGETLFRSADGCDWPAVPGLGVVSDAAFDPSDGRFALATSATPGVANTIWTSSDAGSTFVPAFPPVADRRFGSVAYGDGEIWATATDDAGLRLFLWVQTGGTWVEHELPPSGATAELRVSSVGVGEVWLVLDPFGADTVIHARSDGSSDVVLARNITVTDTAWDGVRLWVVQDGVFLLSLEGGTVVEHPEYPLGLGITLADGALWTAPESHLVGAMLSRSTDAGATFETVAFPDDIVAPWSCEPGTVVATVCGPLWELLLPRIRGYDEPPIDTGVATEPEIPPHRDPEEEPVVEDDGDRGCGCDHAGGVGWLWVTAIWVMRRNRRST